MMFSQVPSKMDQAKEAVQEAKASLSKLGSLFGR